MPVYEAKFIECGKCGTKEDIRQIRRRGTLACALCKEPLAELIELDSCDWSSGDYFPTPEEQP